MRILFINQFFWPELAATSVLLTDLARFLQEQGHKVTVICSAAKYAGADATTRPSVDVVSLPTMNFGRGGVARMASYGSFLVGAFFQSFRVRSFDVVVTMTTPPLTSMIGACLRKFRGVKHYVWEMDMYPDVAVDLGVVSPDSFFTRTVGRLADWGRSHSDRVIALGDCMKARLLARGVPEEKIRIAGNWADGDLFRPASKQVSSNQLTVVYTGNLGMGHDVDTLCETLLALGTHSRVRFVFVGGGERMNTVQSVCKENGLNSAVFMPYVTRERLNEIMSEADLGLVTQNPSCVGSIVPSKFYSLTAAGLPVLYIGAGHATPAKLIDQFQCGWFVPAGHSQDLASLLSTLADDRAQVEQAGRAAHEAFRELWDRPVAVQHLAEMLDLASQNARVTQEERQGEKERAYQRA